MPRRLLAAILSVAVASPLSASAYDNRNRLITKATSEGTLSYTCGAAAM